LRRGTIVVGGRTGGEKDVEKEGDLKSTNQTCKGGRGTWTTKV